MKWLTSLCSFQAKRDADDSPHTHQTDCIDLKTHRDCGRVNMARRGLDNGIHTQSV